MTVVNGNPNRGLTVEEAQQAVDEFLAEYNGNIPITAIVRATQEEIYGTEASREKLGYRIDGAYHPARGLFTLAASNLGDKGAVRRTLRHELLGHYGLNTFQPAEKRALLDRVLETRNEPSLSHIWERVERDYASLPELHRAEEVFAFVAEEERSFICLAWDKVRAVLQHAMRVSGLTDRQLTLAELREEARHIAKGIRAGIRQQQTFPQSDHAQFRLDPDTHAKILEQIVTTMLAASSPVQQPVAILLGGQPGAGKSFLSSTAMDDLGWNAVKIDADELRKYHPAYHSLSREDDRSAADRTHPDAASWAVKLTVAAATARRNLVVDGTMRDQNALAVLCQKLRSASYRIEARVLAVNELVSRLSIHDRYERQVLANGYGRWSNRDKHDAAYASIPLTVEVLEFQQLVDRVAIFSRGASTPLYDNHLQGGAWQFDPAGRRHIETERDRDWTSAEHQHFSQQLAHIAGRMAQRAASALELAALEALRHDHEQVQQRDKHSVQLRPATRSVPRQKL